VETLQIDRADGVVTITLDRPARKNAINAVMWSELGEALRAIDASDEDRVVVITGAGGAFSSGADLGGGGEGRPRHQLAVMRAVNDVCLQLHGLRQPTIAKVGGVAAGAGANLALGCDLILAAESARFAQIFVKRGLSVDFGGTWLLPRLIGLHKAKELALFGELISAQEAASLGLVNAVVADGELDARCAEWAGRLAAGPPIAMAQTKQMLNAALERSLPESLEAEAWSQTVNLTTRDTREAIDAFRQKREPRFEGR
jgi:2-(1,2-epoxy-1,2-dihydrophenyl)acetyl-CoA isomerase